MNELSESTSTSKRIKKKPQKAKLIKEMVSLFFSVDIMVFDFPHFLFFQVQYINYCCKHYVEILRRNFYIFFHGSHYLKRE